MSDIKPVLRNGLWHITGTLKIPGRKTGIRVRESTGLTRLKDAEAYRDKLRQEILERELHGAAYTLTFADCVLIYLEKGGEKRFMKPILERFGHMRVKDITGDKVSAFATERFGHLAPASVKRFYYTPLNAALRKGCKESNVPVRTFEAPSVERSAVEHAPAGWFRDFFPAAHFRIAVTVLFLTTTGRRVTEACRLTVEDCLFDHPRGPRVLIRKTKGGKPIMVPLSETLARAIKRLLEADQITKGESPVFGYAGRWSVNQAIERTCKAAGLKYYSSHKLGRHAFAARLLDAGHSLQHVKDAGGWASIQIVSDVYGHLAESATDAAILDMGSEVSNQIDDTRLTHVHNGHQRKNKENPVRPRVKMVGTRGIEPLTPTMSRVTSQGCLEGKLLEGKGKSASDGVGTCEELAGNQQGTDVSGVTRD